MALVNEHFLKLSNSYLFADIAKKVNAFKVSHPQMRVISLGIGDVTQPLCPAVVEAMHKAVDEMASTTEQRATRETSARLCAGTTPSASPTRFTPYISTRT